MYLSACLPGHRERKIEENKYKRDKESKKKQRKHRGNSYYRRIPEITKQEIILSEMYR
jgi:hypothetical protein